MSEVARGELPPIKTKIMMNVGNPQLAFDFQSVPNAGVGLARLEFIINNNIGVHPKAILEYPNIDADLKKAVESVARGHASPKAFYVDKLAEGIATIAAAFWPKPVIVRLSDFKSNEYKKLIGGSRYEPDEENPMLGFRGAARYLAADFAESFEMECAAMKRVRNDMGLTNVEIMVPFVRTLGQAEKVVDLLGKNGLKRGENGLRLIMMCEVPSNAILAERVPRALRRLLDRFERPDPADAGPGPRFRHGAAGGRLRRARPGRQGAAVDGDQGLPRAGQVHRHLRPGSFGPSGLRRMADGRRDRVDVAESGLGDRHLAEARGDVSGTMNVDSSLKLDKLQVSIQRIQTL